MPVRFVIFIVTCSVLAVSLSAFYSLCRDVTLKRRLHPWLQAICGFVFIFFMWWIEPDASILLFAPFIVLVTFLNATLITFCGTCAKLIHPFSFSKFCPGCGARLKAEEESDSQDAGCMRVPESPPDAFIDVSQVKSLPEPRDLSPEELKKVDALFKEQFTRAKQRRHDDKRP